ncbi:glycosyl transferase [Brachybacterium faecium DSM 4810]|uniref:4,4'-diaponeurosporenoate glycosyltransferase n=1 Tax=Brachybacterium faecium (strain ATCC 43885 / DSM 4810 / JCM 11609 / LMG 19847 / NBRC 14762 / NCIMB 9860 / 6-10) TaxID=446465 RepID=C7MFZ6_BRAFD|nr:glycosyltransferase family A protein [Brachybacterium faecium]ACU84114.1 glycosyl transferase [Brachybacterium faecium DSM 4810]
METTPARPPLTCSVVVPVRDDAPELRGLLQALAQQTRPALEVIVVDNGSSDGSAELARAAGCTVLEHPVPGIAGAAAAGYDAARGDLIVRCDADSRPSPGWLAAHQHAHAHGAAGTVLVTGPGWFRLPRPWSGLVSAVYVGGYLLLTAAALAHAPTFGTTMSMPRRWWREARTTASRSPDVHDDMDLSFQVRPGERVRVRRAVGVSMSPRALRLDRGQLLRWRRAAYTLRRNWRRERPWERWRARCAAASGLGAGHREHDG